MDKIARNQDSCVGSRITSSNGIDQIASLIGLCEKKNRLANFSRVLKILHNVWDFQLPRKLCQKLREALDCFGFVGTKFQRMRVCG